MKKLFSSIPRDFLLFLLATCFIAFAQSIFDSGFNNFLNERFAISSFQRTLTEIPREIPGLGIVVISALFFFLCNRTMAALAQFFAAAGILLIGVCSSSYPLALVWLFVFSLGQHLFQPLAPDIGMELASGGKPGQRLGQLQGAATAAAIAGTFLVFVGFKFLHMGFTAAFVLSSCCFFAGTALILMMRRNRPVPTATRFTFHREYSLYYILSLLFGTRKQIFLTFAPWMLVTVFLQKTQIIALLMTISGLLGIAFKLWLGRAIDRYGEKIILAADAAALVVICLGYGFAKKLFSAETALLVVASCYVVDQILMSSMGMARATYLYRIARSPQEVTSGLTAGFGLDHIFSITIALTGGIIWKMVGYEYIFVLCAVFMLVNLFFALKIQTSPRPLSSPDAPPLPAEGR